MIECEVCKSKEYGSDDPIILCDGDHGDAECGYHINCVTPPLGHVPEGDWLCPPCVTAGNFIIASVIDKCTFHGKVYYKVIWQGYAEPSWQLQSDIPEGSKHLVNHYNRNNKRKRQHFTL